MRRIATGLPNSPATIGHGITVWTHTPEVTEGQLAETRLILQSFGQEVYVRDENFGATANLFTRRSVFDAVGGSVEYPGNVLQIQLSIMLNRKPIFPGIIELNFQAGEVLGCNVYLVYDADQWLLIDIGYEETVDDFIEIIRQLDFPLSRCKTLVATHADVDHIQGLAKAKQLLKTTVTAHPNAVVPLQTGDTLITLAEIEAQDLKMAMPPVEIETQVNDGDIIQVG